MANNLLISLSSSGQVLPNFWVNPANGVSYLVAVQTPQYDVHNLSGVTDLSLPTLGANQGQSSNQMLSNVSTVERTTSPEVINHYDIQPTFDIYANVEGRDLGGVARDVQTAINSFHSKLPHGTNVVVRGQVESMNASFAGLASGLVGAIVLVYLLLVVNYQSWVDPFVIICALPGAMSGILIMLFVTNTTFSVPALMGAIMCVGVATANSVLVVNFANDCREAGDDAITATVTAGCTRLRPVLMTALAMILGMLPMALAFGEGGEQNAPLGRAVIGGLIVATVTTLLFVPIVYSVLRKAQPNRIEQEPGRAGPTGKFKRRCGPRPQSVNMENQPKPIAKAAKAPRIPKQKESRPKGRPKTGLWITCAVLVALAYFGIAPRLRASQHLESEISTVKSEIPIVSVIQLKPGSGSTELTLPSTIQAIKETSISARTTGYLSQRFVDIGYHVKAGQVLATIEAPEVDQQLSQPKRTPHDRSRADSRRSPMWRAYRPQLLRQRPNRPDRSRVWMRSAPI